ncbi:MAG: hypothetical protein AB1585_08010 [Thermodesulfobacteriota bacterium]
MRQCNRKEDGKISGPILILGILLAVSLLLVIVTQFYGVKLTLEDYVGLQVKKLELLSRMQVNLFKAVEAEKMAVSADTDESSIAFADQSRRKSDALETDLKEFVLLAKKDSTNREMDLIRELEHNWREFKAVDKDLLDFAVKNTNLKAAKISFVQGGEILHRLEKALEGIIQEQEENRQDLRIMRRSCQMMIAAQKIYALHAPHIAATQDSQMDALEKEMKKHERDITDDLAVLTRILPEKDLKTLEQAREASKDFSRITAKVVELSRQNTNIKSFEISLGRKRKITAACDEVLRSLEEVVRSQSFKATR